MNWAPCLAASWAYPSCFWIIDSLSPVQVAWTSARDRHGEGARRGARSPRLAAEPAAQGVLQLDVDRDQMLRAVIDFGGALRDGGVGLFYYAGHAMQFQGRNYLMPIDARLELLGRPGRVAEDVGLDVRLVLGARLMLVAFEHRIDHVEPGDRL